MRKFGDKIMTTQFKTVSKVIVSVLLVAAFLFIVLFTCVDNLAFAAGPEITYKWHVEDATGKTINIANNADIKQSNPSSYNGYVVGAHYTMEPNPWFNFDGWYVEEKNNVRSYKVGPLMEHNTSTTLYGAYVFKYGPGDVNGDGKVNNADVIAYCDYIVNPKSFKVVKEGQEWACSQNSEYLAPNVNLFFERNAKGFGNGTSVGLLALTNLRMAIAKGYGLEVSNGEVTDLTEVYFYRNIPSWTPHAYIWSDEGEYNNKKWPGTEMDSAASTEGTNWYSVKIPNNLTNTKIIFNGGDSGGQTEDLTLEAGKRYYSNYQWNATPSNTTSNVRVYFYNNNKSWTNIPKLYTSGSWPGSAMTSSSYAKLYYSAVSTNTTLLIFNNNGNGSNQTVDITPNWSTPYYTLNSLGSSWSVNSYATLENTTLYYYRPTAGKVYAHLWDASSGSSVDYTSWPGKEMTPVLSAPGWYSCKIPFYVTHVLFNGGGDSYKWEEMGINKNNLYYNSDYNAGWKSESNKDTTCYLMVDGVRYPMKNDSSTQDSITIKLYAGQKVQVKWRTGSNSPVQGQALGSPSNGVYTVESTGYYTFWCQSGACYIS